VTKRICLGLQRKDAHLLEHGVETGIIRQLPSGAYVEDTRPVSDDLRAVLEYNRVGRPELTAPRAGEDADGVPAPDARTPMGRVRTRVNRLLTESIPVEADGHGNGHGNGHAAPAAVTADEQGAERPELEQGGTDGEGTGH
jgi:ubiquinol-cytochrome c reductase cytochrome b subunit